jgi:prepilin-type N-terminal cleavage/methylation domain-containing protein
MFNKRGFTLAELVVAITILAIISAVGFSTFSQSQIRGRDSRRKSDLRAISVALELFRQKNGRYPCTGVGSLGQNESSLTSSSWIVDRDSSNASQCSGTNTNLAPTYISSVPVDPLNSGSYNYLYQSTGKDYGGTCLAGQSYFLYATLENVNDPDLYIRKPFNICGENPISWCNSSDPTTGCKYFIIVGQ